MKDEKDNSRINLTYEQYSLCEEALELWIKIEKEELKNVKPTKMDEVLELFKNKYKVNKESYSFNLNLSQFCYLHNSLSDLCLFYNGNQEKIKEICLVLENIIKKYNNRLSSVICYPVSKWDEIDR